MARRFTDIYVYLMLAGLPSIVSGSGYTGITAVKHLFFVIATLSWLALALGFSVFEFFRGEKNALRFFLTPAGWAVLAFLLISTVSALASPYPFREVFAGTGRYDGLHATLLYGAVFLGLSQWGERKTSYIYAFAAAMALSCTVAVLQLMRYNPLSLFPAGYDYYDGGILYSGKYLGLSGNVIIMGALLSISIPLFIGGYIAGMRSLGAKALALLLLSGGLGLLILMISGAEGALLAVFSGLILSAPVIISQRKKKPGGSRRFFAIYFSAVFVLALAALAAVYNTGAESGTVYELSRILHGELSDSFGSSRVRIWREAMALIAERPLLGAGPGTLASRLQIEFSRFVPETGKTLQSFVDNAHNEYIAHLANTGVFGLAAYLTALIFSAIPFFKGSGGIWRTVFGAAVLSGSVEAFFGLGLCLSAPIFWLIWGLFEAKPHAALSEYRKTAGSG